MFLLSPPLLSLSCCCSPPPSLLLSYLADSLPLQMYVSNLQLEEWGGRFTGTNGPSCQEADGILCQEKLGIFQRAAPLVKKWQRDTHLSIKSDGQGLLKSWPSSSQPWRKMRCTRAACALSPSPAPPPPAMWMPFPLGWQRAISRSMLAGVPRLEGLRVRLGQILTCSFRYQLRQRPKAAGLECSDLNTARSLCFEPGPCLPPWLCPTLSQLCIHKGLGGSGPEGSLSHRADPVMCQEVWEVDVISSLLSWER